MLNVNTKKRDMNEAVLAQAMFNGVTTVRKQQATQKNSVICREKLNFVL